MDRVSIYHPRPQFLPFHDRSQRWAAIVCHRRAGKTVAGVNELITRALYTKKEDARYSYIAPFYAQAKAVAWDYLLKFSEPFRVKANIAELSVDLFNGSRCRLFGGDNPDALRGLYHDGVLLDEPAQMKPSLWGEVIRPALSDRLGWAVFMGTPKGKNSFWKVWDEAGADPEWFRFMLKACESGILPQGELDDARRTMDDDEYNQEYECSFDAAIKGSFYGKLINQMGERIGNFPYEEGFRVHTCWDLGYTDDTVIWFFQVVLGRPVFFDCYAASGESLDAYIDVLHEKRLKYNLHYGEYYLPHDARAHSLQTGRSVQEDLIKHGVRAKIVPDIGVQDGIMATRKMLEVACFDEKNCATGIEALRQYQREWNEDKKAFSQRPRHDWCVTADTQVLTRYGMRRIMDLSIDDEVATSWGWRAHLGARMTRPDAPLVAVTFADGYSVRCTPDHPFKTASGWKFAEDLSPGTLILSFSTPQHSISTENSTDGGLQAADTSVMAADTCTGTSGRRHSVQYRQSATSITATPITQTTALKILSAWMRESIAGFLQASIRTMQKALFLQQQEPALPLGMPARKDASGTVGMLLPAKTGRSGAGNRVNALPAKQYSSASCGRMEKNSDIALQTARPLHIASVRHLPYREDVWCISVPGIEEFALANGALVHNTSHYADGLRMGAIGWQEEADSTLVYIPPNRRAKPLYTQGTNLNELWKQLPSRRRGTARI